jgi:hypothetical protein
MAYFQHSAADCFDLSAGYSALGIGPLASERCHHRQPEDDAFLDFTGLDVNLNVNEYLRRELPFELKWQSSLELKNLVKAGRLGKKTGSGWYEYNK